MRLCVFEDAGVANLEPLSLTRAAFDLWLGAGTLLTRVQRTFPATELGALVRPSLANLCRLQHPEMAVNDVAWLRRSPVLLVNARWLPTAIPATVPTIGQVMWAGEQLAYAYLNCVNLDEATPAQLTIRITDLQRNGCSVQAGGRMVNYPWHLVDNNPDAVAQDYLTWRESKTRTTTLDQFSVVGPRELVVVDQEAKVEPHVLFDTTRGPVLIDRRATVQAFSRLEGPCYVGQGTQILAARCAAAVSVPNVGSAEKSKPPLCRGTATNITMAFSGIPTSASGSTSVPVRTPAICARTTARLR